LISLFSVHFSFSIVADLLKERIEPHPDDSSFSRTYTVQEIKPTTSQHASPIPPSAPADDTAIPIPTPPVLTPFPRLPTPPLLRVSPPPPPEKPITPPPEKPITPPPESFATPPPEQSATSSPEQNIPQLPESPPPYMTNFEKIRRGIIYIYINSIS
jgi:hypothetical protein